LNTQKSTTLKKSTVMKAFNAYLIFNGNCRQAMEFYARSLGADLQVMTYGDGPGGGPGCDSGGQMTPHIRTANRARPPGAILFCSLCLEPIPAR
jgi:uncharacterized glyoxalase superfamily protein PhnB